MAYFGTFCLDRERDITVELDMTDHVLSYILRTPNHGTGNLITNLAKLCRLPLSEDENGLKVIRGTIPCYINDENLPIYILHLGETKVANIYPDGRIERKASIPAISKTLMSQTKDYRLDFRKTLVKTYILRECKFRTDLHTHMNANLDPETLIALGIHHQIRYPLYYIKKLELRCSDRQKRELEKKREEAKARFASSPLTGKYLDRKIDDNTFLNFADLILRNPRDAEYNLNRIRNSLAVLKDGQAVFTNLEKVYLYRYVFTRGIPSEKKISLEGMEEIPDPVVRETLKKMTEDRANPVYASFTLLQDKLLWIARGCEKHGICYMEISDTTLVKPEQAPLLLEQIHEAMPAVTRETGVVLRFLAAMRRIPLTLVRDQLNADFREQLRTLRAVAGDPYVAGSDIVGEEINDIRDLSPVIRRLVQIAGEHPGFVIRIHAGENDSLRDNVDNSIRCVKEALAPGQKMPPLRIGHGLYTANLHSPKGRQLIGDLKESGAVLEFQITSNVRLNNLSDLKHHPLKEYLREGVACVQGTDGGALYGTDSIDEQLALEKLLELDRGELLTMRRTEEGILQESLKTFREKMKAYEKNAAGADPEEYYAELIRGEEAENAGPDGESEKLDSAERLKAGIRELPTGKVPVILAGGSFNSDRHTTRLRDGQKALLRKITEKCDPEKAFFVIGHRLTAYERELIQLAGGRFEIFAIVPTRMTETEARRLEDSGAGIRISIEPTGMGLYKSFAYEIFKRRPSVLLALDGNSAGVNLIQEARNGRYRARIFVSRHSRTLAAKAGTLEGYVTLISGEEDAEKVLKAIREGGENA